MDPHAHEDHDRIGVPPSQLRGGATPGSGAPGRTPPPSDRQGPDPSSFGWGLLLVVGVIALVVVVLLLTGTFTR